MKENYLDCFVEVFKHKVFPNNTNHEWLIAVLYIQFQHKTSHTQVLLNKLRLYLYDNDGK
jgi:hypothetical protein